MTHVLQVDASMRHEGSISRKLAALAVSRLGPTQVTVRDLSEGIESIDENWIGANFTDPDARTEAQRAHLAYSDTLVAELKAADVLVIGLPVYNFGVPAAFKAWIDQVARARETFRYTENGPVGLLTGKRAVVVFASGGTGMDSAIDFATPYVRHILGFLGITEVEFVAAERLMVDADQAMETAGDQIGSLAA